jgi:hypothetical protein
MEIELSGTVRGEPVMVRWREGDLDGNAELLQRIAHMLADGRCDLTDLTSVIHCVEFAAGQRMKLRVVDGGTPRPSRIISAA